MFYRIFKCILIRIDGKYILLNPFDIKLIEVERDYIKIIMVNGEKHLKRSTMDRIEKKLGQDFLCRVHRSYIVNTYHIKEVYDNVISFGTLEVPLQKKYAAFFMQQFLLID